MPNQCLNLVAGHAGGGHGYAVFFRGGQAKVKVLKHQLRCERHVKIQMSERRRLIAGEHRSHHAFVEERQKIMTFQPGLFSQNKNFAEVLGDHAQHDVVANLGDSRQVTLAHIGNGTGNNLQIGLDFLVSRSGPRGYHG